MSTPQDLPQEILIFFLLKSIDDEGGEAWNKKLSILAKAEFWSIYPYLENKHKNNNSWTARISRTCIAMSRNGFLEGINQRSPQKWRITEKGREKLLDSAAKNRDASNYSSSAKFVVNHSQDSNILIAISKDETIAQTECDALIRSRLGQGKFRDDLICFWDGKCAVTGLSLVRVLIASHIKPWCDSDNHERLDPFNGLLLSPNLDALFDSFLVSFDSEGKIIISSFINHDACKFLGVDDEMKLSKINDRHQDYLEYHRQRFFKKDNY